MKQFSKQFNNKAKTITLSPAERQKLRASVISYMEYHPLPAGLKTTSASKATEGYRVVSLPFSLFSRWTVVAGVLLLLVVPLLAEQSVPGDSLYAIKVRFNEEVRGTLALSPYQKVEWETKRLNRRIAEVRLLASEGRLTEDVEVEMAAAVREHTENVEREIEVLRADDADQATLASIELNTTLQVQSSSFEAEPDPTSIAAAPVASDSSTQFLVDVINESLAKRESDVADTIPSYEKVMARVEMNTTRAYELLNSLGLDQASDSHAEITRRLEDVNRSIMQAGELRSSDEKAASATLVDTLQRTQKLIVFMTELEQSKTVVLETLVPVVLTYDEEVAALAVHSKEIEKKTALLDAAQPLLSAPVAEKISYTLSLVADAQAKIASSTQPVEGNKTATEVLGLIEDAFILIVADGVSVADIVIPTDEIPPVVEGVATSTDILPI